MFLNDDVSRACRYVPFDFHRICGQLNFVRLSELYDGIAEDLSKQRWNFIHNLDFVNWIQYITLARLTALFILQSNMVMSGA